MSVRAEGGNRLRWDDLPQKVQAVIECGVGAPVAAAESRAGGFSPSLASVLTLADGRQVFVKACDFARNDFAPVALRREAAVLPGLPESVPAPRLRWLHDDGDWVILATDAVDGRTPDQPWRPEQLRRFLDAAAVLPGLLTPTPIAAPVLADEYAGEVGAWHDVTPAQVDPWMRPHLDELRALGDGFAAATGGNTLLHGDLRADNVVLTADGLVFVDWPSVVVGAGWFDLLSALPSIGMHGGGVPEEVWRDHPLARDADPQAVDAALAGLGALFWSRSLQPPVPLLPTIRQFQRAQAEQVVSWLATRRHWRTEP
ncbi:phosphotransferase family protein [Hamadaea tsunoensis]|uniref:phosphotransferase family protein n=1 Tax=Hamadaea tsunoensis TaxID=53368 RepID=UPI000481A570|nr:phosphotransferase [Hamadaea tsunoensis]